MSTMLSRKEFLIGAAAFAGLGATAMLGCSKDQEKTTPEEPKDNDAQTTTTGTRTIIDDFGRKVEIPDVIETVAINGHATRSVVYAGAIDRIAAVCAADVQKATPALPYAYANLDILKDLPVVSSGGPDNTLNEEEVITLEPNIIVSASNDPQMNDEIQQKTGIPVVAIDTSERHPFTDKFIASLRMLGELFGTEDHVEELISHFDIWKQELNDITADIKEADKPRCYPAAVSYRGPHGFAGTYVQYPPFNLAGVINVADEASDKEGAIQVDLEQVAIWDPEYIFINPDNKHLVDEEYSKNPDFFEAFQAVQNKNIYSQPSFIHHGTNMELAVANAYYVASVVYPDKFNIDFEQKVEEIFKAFIGSPHLDALKEYGMGFNALTIGE